MSSPVPLAALAVLPERGDNTAVAVRTIEAGTAVVLPGAAEPVRLPHTVPEGHRFAVAAVPRGAGLLSWNTPFATAERDLAPGDYVCTGRMLEVLRERRMAGAFPGRPNARNRPLDPYVLDEAALPPGRPVEPHPEPGTFLGFDRGRGRGAGTRNHLVVLGMSSSTASFAEALAARFTGGASGGCDGVAAVAHTEGGTGRPGNNHELVLRTLGGFLAHPNAGAVLMVDAPGAEPSAAAVLRHLAEHGRPRPAVPHAVLTRTGSFAQDLDRGAETVRGWLPRLAAARRTELPLAGLRIALQCGGSDAFSGVSANPLAGAVARELIRHGGGAVLAETDELIGAERYLLDNVRDAATARRFLAAVERFKEQVARHGHTAETNVSGGNLHRGLYNIVIKSIGAARKRDPAVRLDHVLEYAEPLPGPGYAFMDSPGNDLESVAGQVASGCNLVFFTTGNGSITNFPFVPTVKLVSTTGRYRRLAAEMDVNAGAYLDGEPMAGLTARTFELAVRVASGERTAGERARHSQVSIWRDWRQTRPLPLLARGAAAAPAELADRELPGRPLPARAGAAAPDTGFLGLDGGAGPLPDQVALIMPTSICSGRIALRLAERLHRHPLRPSRFTRVVALPHTEGCGASGGPSEDTYARTVVGHLTHPLVRAALLLEHGCEKTHNDYFRERLAEAGADPGAFGWASIQGDGGLEAVAERVAAWFDGVLAAAAPLRTAPAPPGALRVALHAHGPVPDEAARAFGRFGAALVAAGGTVVVPSVSPLTASDAFLAEALGPGAAAPGPTLAYGQRALTPGWQVMRAPTEHWTETLTGLGATGAHLVAGHVTGTPPPAHRMVPLLRASADPGTLAAHGPDVDLRLRPDGSDWAQGLLEAAAAVASRERVPAASGPDVGFQVTRGLLGVSI
ncbi:UxaA family hydrolase [Allonocardiopsis opalescens]|uniref:Altronate dehydratase n=1 Tax=Allonocardiopsis opalescens TaxID=1144618 RepID=A0A2T0QEF0_9ACTN|nr:UxaA family hydrolase [Allonocardiopsis opalescens]PRY02223.1 altronate dehydratase [Allonocardiopsis opalescens]